MADEKFEDTAPEERNEILEALGEGLDDVIDPDAVFDEEQDVLEARGIAGDSFLELRRGEKFSDFSERVAPHLQRDGAFWWHVMRQCDGDWMEAFHKGPRLACLGAAYNTGLLSTISEEDYEEIDYLFPYDTLEENVSEYEQQSAGSPFYARYSKEMAEAFAYLAQDFADRGTQWALEAVFDEVRKNMLVVKVAAEEAHSAFDSMAEETRADAPEGTEMIGVADVDENWIPNAFIGMQGAAEARAARVAMEEAAEKVASELGLADEDSSIEYPDDEVIMLLLLQCYIWNGRSWAKVSEKAADMFYGAMSYAKTLFGLKPDFAGDDPAARQARLDELAKKFDDGKGGYALEADESYPPVEGVDEDGNQTMQYRLTPESSEFMQLMEQERILAQLNSEAQVAIKYAQNLPACRDNVHSLLADEIISCLSDAVQSGMRFEEAFDEIVRYLDERKDVLAPQAKSRWKKYLKANPEAAAAAKAGELIVEADEDGNPVFAGDYVPAMREQEQEGASEEE